MEKLWTAVKNNIGVWCLEELRFGMPACQITAYRTRVLGRRTHTHTHTHTTPPHQNRRAKGEQHVHPNDGMCARPAPNSHPPWSEGLSSPFLAVKRAALLQAGSTLQGGNRGWKREPGQSRHRLSPLWALCFCICEVLGLPQGGPVPAPIQQHAAA